ncbi:hypothetical protein IWQ60_009836 [Tieghemiomyces parasiticus]|uniref:Uncharacterized protein n=1 Tax=Tieghemiomyces parasiticus TaxID=78921 RepID=A0A9W7ZS11_9FUNG|nr:hypothetical protein IWQ60_009836 [Tieghemiomyces parasiticus]
MSKRVSNDSDDGWGFGNAVRASSKRTRVKTETTRSPSTLIPQVVVKLPTPPIDEPEPVRGPPRQGRSAVGGGRVIDSVVPVKTPTSHRRPTFPDIMDVPTATGPSLSRQRRRSSGIRGQRRRSSIAANGTILTPHKQIPSRDFYKHISPDEPEPLRMRQLLAYAIPKTRVRTPTPSASGPDTTAIGNIMDELVRKFERAMTRGDVPTSWYRLAEAVEGARAAEPPTPHPANEPLRQRKEGLERSLVRYRKERDLWSRLLRQAEPSSTDLFPVWLTDTATDPISQDTMSPCTAVIRQTRRQLNDGGDLAYTVDQLADAVYLSHTFQRNAKTFIDRLAHDLIVSFQRRWGLAHLTSDPRFTIVETDLAATDGHDPALDYRIPRCAEQDRRAARLIQRTAATDLSRALATLKSGQVDQQMDGPGKATMTSATDIAVEPIDPHLLLKALARIPPSSSAS